MLHHHPWIIEALRAALSWRNEMISMYRSLWAAAQAQSLIVGQSRVLQPSTPVPLQGASAQVAPYYWALVMGNTRQCGHLLTGLYIRHIQDFVHVQIVVLQLPKKRLRIIPSNDAEAATETLRFAFQPISRGGCLGWFVRAGVSFTALPWFPQSLTLDFTIRVRVGGLWLVFERWNPLHRPELTMDFSKSSRFDSPTAVGGNATVPIDSWSCKRST